MTQWSKTTAYVIQPIEDPPEKISMESINTDSGADPKDIVMHEIPLTVNELEFLRTKVDDSNK